jgi:uncharacterized membrane protein
MAGPAHPMVLLVLGLVVFLGAHSTRVFAESWRRGMIARLGEGPWKGFYSLVSIVGFILIIWGYAMARPESAVIYEPPVWLKHVAILLNLLAFILLGIFIAPAGRLKARLGHPMILGVKTWAFAHLLANGRVAELVLFGGFLAWAILDYAASRRRDRESGVVRIPGPARNDAIAVALGVVFWSAMVTRLHAWLIGVSPLA